MEAKTALKLLISFAIALIIDQSLSITQIVREAIEPLLVGPFLYPIKSLIILCFFLAEIGGTYALLNNFLDKFVK